MTGTGPAGHWVMGMNWYHRVERRYIEYGSSFEATRTFGLFRAMYDLVYNMNLDHLSWQAETVFERLGDAGVRTATTPFLIYRGRHRHELGLEGLAKRAAAAANFRHAVWGPDEFFYGDIYASRPDRLRTDLHQAGDARRVLRLRRRGAGPGGRLRLPALQPARQRLPLAPARPGGHPRVDRQGGRHVRPHRRGGRRAGRLPLRARGRAHRRPRPDSGRARTSPRRRAGGGLGRAPAEHGPSRGRRDRGQPDLPSRRRLHPRRRISGSRSPTSEPACASASWPGSTW